MEKTLIKVQSVKVIIVKKASVSEESRKSFCLVYLSVKFMHVFQSTEVFFFRGKYAFFLKGFLY